MTMLVTEKLRALAGVLADLKGRVRAALASEVSRAAADAVRDVVDAALRGGSPASHDEPRPGSDRPHDRDGWNDPEPDPWDDPPEWRDDEADEPTHRGEAGALAPAAAALVYRPAAGPAALTAAWGAGRWWLRRRGSVAEAVAVGLLVGAAVLAGGPLCRAGLTTASAAVELMAVTEALDAGAARLSRV